MLKFGIEVEFACHRSAWTDIQCIIGYDTNYQFELGLDSSASLRKMVGGCSIYLEGYELRTRGKNKPFYDHLSGKRRDRA